MVRSNTWQQNAGGLLKGCSSCRAAGGGGGGAAAAASPSSVASSSLIHSTSFSTSTIAQSKPRRQRQENNSLALQHMGKFDFDDVPTFGHLYLNRTREMLQYARVVQWEMPKLTAFRKEYQPPAAENILRFRSHHYQGEAHPSTRKSVVTVQIKDLFKSGKLNDSLAARKKLLLLAGVRWDPMGEEVFYEDAVSLEKAAIEQGLGRIKISCERFPEERMNLKWCSDTIDRLIEEANTEPEKLQEVPLDMRPTMAGEAKKSGFVRGKGPSIRDFPQSWLPTTAS